MNLVQETLLEELGIATPRRILCVVDGPPASVSAYQERQPDCVVEQLAPTEATAALAALGRYDFGLVHGALETLSREAGSALLARLRDVHCRRLCVTWREPGQSEQEPFWTHARFLSLALALHRRIDQDGECTEIYRYDIDDYNPRREWNNPDKWANPQNFDRYRW